LHSIDSRTLVVTAGNSFRRDDGVGPYIALALEKKKEHRVINAGFNPENIIDDVISLNPEKVIFIDSADFGGRVGEVRLIAEDTLPEATISTHNIPLYVISRIIQKEINPLSVVFVGIQIKTIQFGEELSEEVKFAADAIIRFIFKI
jgi:hydrogenase 3 maturation protease